MIRLGVWGHYTIITIRSLQHSIGNYLQRSRCIVIHCKASRLKSNHHTITTLRRKDWTWCPSGASLRTPHLARHAHAPTSYYLLAGPASQLPDALLWCHGGVDPTPIMERSGKNHHARNPVFRALISA